MDDVERQRDLCELKHRCAMLSDETRGLLLKLLEKPRAFEAPYTLHPLSDWHEDIGPVLWWTLPVCEPPTLGCNPIEEFGEGMFTHFSIIPSANFMTATDGTSVGGH